MPKWVSSKLPYARFVLAILALLLGFACGGPAPSDESETGEPASREIELRVDACELLTASDIEEVFGVAPGVPQADTEDPQQCTWPKSDGSEEALVHLLVTDSSYDSYDEWVSRYAQEVGEEPGSNYRRIEGIGDWGLYIIPERALEVYEGEMMLEVQVASEWGEEAARALAERALPRLP